jgi:hypothetical protein
VFLNKFLVVNIFQNQNFAIGNCLNDRYGLYYSTESSNYSIKKSFKNLNKDLT